MRSIGKKIAEFICAIQFTVIVVGLVKISIVLWNFLTQCQSSDYWQLYDVTYQLIESSFYDVVFIMSSIFMQDGLYMIVFSSGNMLMCQKRGIRNIKDIC